MKIQSETNPNDRFSLILNHSLLGNRPLKKGHRNVYQYTFCGIEVKVIGAFTQNLLRMQTKFKHDENKNG